MTQKKSNIYTKQGDGGMTSLVGGQRLHKSDAVIAKYGEVDELNSSIGLIMAFLPNVSKSVEIKKSLKSIQNKLFDLGSNLACLPQDRNNFKLPQLDSQFINFLEDEIDKMDRELPPIKNFVLPGGTKSSSFAHLARTICRRAERTIAMGDTNFLPALAMEFINRLSDYLFVLARYLNHIENVSDELWKP